MKNIIFYLEYSSAKDKRLNKNTGNCIAVLKDVPANPGKVSALSAVYMWPNSATNFGEISFDYLRERCKRIPEPIAEIIHPELYNRLKSDLSNDQ